MISRVWKWVCVTLGGGLILAALAIGGYHVFLLSQGRTVAYQIPYLSTIVRLGKVPKSFFSKSVDASYTFQVENGQVTRVPKYVDDMIVDRWDDGALWAHDIRTGQQKLYYWTDDSVYECIDLKHMKFDTNDPNFIQPDPKTQLANFHWYFSGDAAPGDINLLGFSHLEADVSPSDPVKLFLRNRTPDAGGGFDLVGVFPLISKAACKRSRLNEARFR